MRCCCAHCRTRTLSDSSGSRPTVSASDRIRLRRAATTWCGSSKPNGSKEWPLMARSTGHVRPSAGQNIGEPQLAVTDALVLDVREPHEFAAGHIPNAINVPLSQLRDRSAEV